MKIKINQKADGFSISVGDRESELVDYGDVAELVLTPSTHRILASVDIGEAGELDADGKDLAGQAFPVSEFWAYEATPIPDEYIEFVEEDDEPEEEPATVSPNITQVVSLPPSAQVVTAVQIEEPKKENEEDGKAGS